MTLGTKRPPSGASPFKKTSLKEKVLSLFLVLIYSIPSISTEFWYYLVKTNKYNTYMTAIDNLFEDPSVDPIHGLLVIISACFHGEDPVDKINQYIKIKKLKLPLEVYTQILNHGPECWKDTQECNLERIADNQVMNYIMQHAEECWDESDVCTEKINQIIRYL